MIKIEKKYLSFNELKDKWKATSDDVHYLIQDASLTPAIAWNGYVRNCQWEPNENGKSFLTLTGDPKFSFPGWLYLRLPTAAGNCNYKFSYGTKTPYADYDHFKTDVWFKFLEGADEVASAFIDREYIEKNAVFMADVVDNTEVFELGMIETKKDLIIENESSMKAYNTDLLNLLNLTVTNFFNPRHPIDAKKEEVTKWIRDKGKELNIYVSDNVADSIFTIIKPNDHNPKIKRVDPQN